MANRYKLIHTGNRGSEINSLTEKTTPVDADMVGLMDSEASNVLKKLSWANIKRNINPDGWVDANETWTYASADDPTFTFTISGDKNSKYSAGMRIKLTQTTVKYFIITKVEYSSPNTTITVYGGTEYDLADATITLPYYSTQKAPFGFPLDPIKWTVETSDTSERSTSSPTIGTKYNVSQVNISIPIGLWNVMYQCNLGGNNNSSDNDYFCTLSTANNSESDVDRTCNIIVTTASYINTTVTNTKPLNLSTKATYYLNYWTNRDSVESVGIYGNRSKTIVRASCAYL